MRFAYSIFGLTAIIMTVPTSAAAENVLVGVSKIKTSEACPSAKSGYCAPILGGRLKLDKNPLLISVQNIDSIYPYILGFYKTGDRSGSYPGQCLTQPIEKNMIKEATIGNFQITYKPNKTKLFGAGVDISAALKTAGVSSELIERTQSSIKLAISKIGDYEFKTSAAYRTYILDAQIISNLKGLSPNEKFKPCLDYIKKNTGSKLTLAIGGFLIDTSTGKSDVKKILSAGIVAALKKEGVSDSDIASFSTGIDNISTRIVETSLNPVYEGRAINFIDYSNLP
jgi:hypothetical protein